MTNDSRELGQQWKKQIETRPRVLFSVLWGCLNQSPGTGGAWAGLGAASAQHSTQSHETTGERSRDKGPAWGHLQRNPSASGILGHHFNLSLRARI